MTTLFVDHDEPDAAELERDAKRTAKKKPDRAVDPDVWELCRKGLHKLCPREVLAQAPWATAGDPPPTPDAPRIRRIKCACTCGHKWGNS